ncbi:FRG domain-containing protein [Sanguibacter sp. Leaf3]|uniref:FRG domain-containing protein n=1 Tax=Sanguibacter sp. Leaf3 TaxID=1736209 RepID=UPI00138F5F30|nr:FRG domain-containing protein [Sanguibacter sp. Leaf3]
MHTTFQDEVWLWRGQADHTHGIEPSVHTRVRKSTFDQTEETVKSATANLLLHARTAHLDRQSETLLPDLALLAHLQHYGAATPLLDVSTDPLIALWMVAFADKEQPNKFDDRAGSLFGILKPPRERWIKPLDPRSYGGPQGQNISDSLGNAVWWYEAPDVTERLRIQRGSFLIGPLANADNSDSTLPFDLGPSTKPKPGGRSKKAATSPSVETQEDGKTTLNPADHWLDSRIRNQGDPGSPVQRRSEAFRIYVPPSSKQHLRKLLLERSGLSVATVYPTPWNRPFITQFAEVFDRLRPLSLDLPTRHQVEIGPLVQADGTV